MNGNGPTHDADEAKRLKVEARENYFQDYADAEV